MSHLRDKCQRLLNLILQRGIYSQSLKLQGPQCPNSLAFSPQGEYLASGGDAAIRIWRLPAGDPVIAPDYATNLHGQITALKWVVDTGNRSLRILIGTGLGKLLMWSYDATEDRFYEKQVKENSHAGAVEAISVDGLKVAVVYRHHMIITFTLRENEIAQAWTHQFHGTIPRSVAHFEGEILVWGFMNGILHRFAVDTGREGEMKKFAERIGCGIYRRDNGRVEYAIDIMDDGFKIFKASDTQEAFRFCRVPRKQTFVVCKQALWVEDDRFLATGSDHGKVYIFDNSSTCIQKLKHGADDEIVQTIASTKSLAKFMLATTSMEGEGMVRVWTKERKQSSATWQVIRLILYTLVVYILLCGISKALAEMITSFLLPLSSFWQQLKNLSSDIPALGRQIQNTLRLMIRYMFNVARKSLEGTWVWLYKDEPPSKSSRQKLLEESRRLTRHFSL